MKFERKNSYVFDTSTNKKYHFASENDAKEICDLLNEYYDKIISLETEADFLQMKNNEIMYVLKNIRQIELR